MSRKPQQLKSIGSLLLVGAGKMGGAMLDGWLARGLNPKKVAVIEPLPATLVKRLTRRGLKLNPKGKPAQAAAIVIAVKPQTAPAAVPPLRSHVGKSTLVLSIMAGRTISFLEKHLPPGTAIVRAMPNTPASIGRSITVAVANAKVSARQRKQASDLLAAIGKVEWVGDEKLIDAVTALSGSGPAYVFLLAEALQAAGEAEGLSAEATRTLVQQTILGAARMLIENDEAPAELRRRVTSPGGTTQAAIETFEAGNFRDLVSRAIRAATERGKQLSAAND